MRGVNDTQEFLFQVGAAIERIENLAAQRIAQNRVDGKIAAARGVFKARVRVAFNGKTAMALSGFQVAARQADIEFVARAVVVQASL